MKKLLALAAVVLTVTLGRLGIAAAEDNNTVPPQNGPAYCDGAYGNGYHHHYNGNNGNGGNYGRGYHHGWNNGGCHW
ncbi:MAG: hypothetical protein LKE33_02440 [Acidaminococcus sp.]|jgi:hypothetical protein|nr:hypothetical protein [Acidaminococcus sp.]MCI2101077.1 hypothetical protein [Acidaminococcus sp.]MCI2115492.1 hypothetical protein [Acidaminococcus sp.]MCI2117614.1 hypothetical protein [Acidaminococcus sp.]